MPATEGAPFSWGCVVLVLASEPTSDCGIVCKVEFEARSTDSEPEFAVRTVATVAVDPFSRGCVLAANVTADVDTAACG